jgi:hypothetical protein
MDIFQVPRREAPASILLDDGRVLEGQLYLAVAGHDGRPETVGERLNQTGEEFVPMACGGDRFLINKSGIIAVTVPDEADAVREDEGNGAKKAAVRLSLAGGTSLIGRLHIAMPLERSRVLDYLNAAPRFLALHAQNGVTLVHRRFIVSVRSDD